MKTPKRLPNELGYIINMERSLFDMELVDAVFSCASGHKILTWQTTVMNAEGDGYIGVYSERWDKKRQKIKIRNERVGFNLLKLQGLFERNFK